MEEINSTKPNLHRSAYNIYLSDEENGKNFIFNTWKGSLLEIEDNTFNFIKSQEYEKISDANLTKLNNTGLLTSIEDEYHAVVSENELRFKKGKNFSIVITVTSCCNANCAYCFENGITRKTLSDSNVNAVCDYIKENSNNRIVHITWFGGEPLLATKQIEKITNILKDGKVDFYSTIITNGYYIDKYATKMKKDWNIVAAQITIDGLFEKYDDIKNYNGDHNAFGKIISNIHFAVENGIRVTIRVNFDALHYEDYKEIIQFVHNEFGNSVRIYFHDIFGLDYKLANTIPNNPHMAIFNELVKYGYIKTLRDLKITRKYKFCAISKNDYINLCPDGSVVKCEHYVGRHNTSFNLGNISDQNFNPSKKFDVSHKECEKCKCYPICGGGCLASWLEQPRGGCLPIKNVLDKVLLLYVENIYNEK